MEDSVEEPQPKKQRRSGDVQIICGDALSKLEELPANTVQCCVTSPPYWGLRDYGMETQIGAEDSLDSYINVIVRVFREVRRVLKEDGILWLNIGDGYTSGGRKKRAPDKKNPARQMTYLQDTPDGLKPKDLLGIPWRIAFALQQDGWFLRCDCIWNKPNCQPESVKDRPTRSHEYVFLLTPNSRYKFDSVAIKELACDGSLRNRRSVLSIQTEAFRGAHFATFPKKLVELLIISGSAEGDTILDPFFGSGTVGVVAEKLNRKAIGIEINPKYVEIAEKRLMEKK